MGSTRLPGKILRPLAGKPMLWHVLHRLQKSTMLDAICVATSDQPADDAVAEFLAQNRSEFDVVLVRGSEDDVLARFRAAAQQTAADIIVRVTADAPLVDAALIDRMVGQLIADRSDYITVPQGTACIDEGIDPFTRSALDRLWAQARDDQIAREHVSGYFKKYPDFALTSDFDPGPDHCFSGARLSVDTPADLSFMEQIHGRLGVDAGEIVIGDLVDLLKVEPGLLEINNHVVRKALDDNAGCVLIICDVGGGKGYGHLSRCLAIAEAVRDDHGLGVIFAFPTDGPTDQPVADQQAAEQMTAARGFPVKLVGSLDPESEISKIISNNNIISAIFDVRNEYSGTLVKRVQQRGILTIVLDDPGDRRLCGDYAIYPPVPQIEAMDWSGYGGELLRGWEWSMLGARGIATRPGTADCRSDLSGQASGKSRVVISMGGSDPASLTLPVVRAARYLVVGYHMQVVIGPGFSAPDRLVRQIGDISRDIEILTGMDDLTEVLSGAHLTILAFGVTAYEAATLGVPALYLCLTDDHRQSASAFEAAEIGRVIDTPMPDGNSTFVDEGKITATLKGILGDDTARLQMAQNGPELIDGKGAARIAALIAEKPL